MWVCSLVYIMDVRVHLRTNSVWRCKEWVCAIIGHLLALSHRSATPGLSTPRSSRTHPEAGRAGLNLSGRCGQEAGIDENMRHDETVPRPSCLAARSTCLKLGVRFTTGFGQCLRFILLDGGWQAACAQRRPGSLARPNRFAQATRSKRSAFITFVHAATKSRTNFASLSSCA